MRAVSTIVGRMAPLRRANVDTDQIMPKQHLKRVERSGFGPYLFYDWAYDAEAEPRPDFILNQSAYLQSKVLITGPNFGCGSSREHAPWGLEDWGFEAIIAPSFADIFYNNCINIGLLPIVLSDDETARFTILAEDPTNIVSIDLQNQTVSCGDAVTRFKIDTFDKHRLSRGLDRVGLTLQRSGDIDNFEDSRPAFKPTLA